MNLQEKELERSILGRGNSKGPEVRNFLSREQEVGAGQSGSAG